MLLFTVVSYIAMARRWGWSAGHGSLKSLMNAPALKANLAPTRILDVLFMSNFVGIVGTKSLHYQFYVWYFNTLPYLLWRASIIPVLIKVLIWVTIEAVWSLGVFYPPNA